MALNLTTYLKNELRKHIFRTGSFTKPLALYMALHTGDPGATGAANEVSGGSYARVNNAPLDANWSAHATDGVTQNVGAITFPAPTANWGSVSYWSIWDAVTGGNCLFKGAMTTAKTVNNGDPAPSFQATQLEIGFTL